MMDPVLFPVVSTGDTSGPIRGVDVITVGPAVAPSTDPSVSNAQADLDALVASKNEHTDRLDGILTVQNPTYTWPEDFDPGAATNIVIGFKVDGIFHATNVDINDVTRTAAGFAAEVNMWLDSAPLLSASGAKLSLVSPWDSTKTSLQITVVTTTPTNVPVVGFGVTRAIGKTLGGVVGQARIDLDAVDVRTQALGNDFDAFSNNVVDLIGSKAPAQAVTDLAAEVHHVTTGLATRASKASVDDLKPLVVLGVTAITASISQLLSSVARPAGAANATHVQFETIGGGASGAASNTLSIPGLGGQPGFIHDSETFLIADLPGTIDFIVGAGGAAHNLGANSSFNQYINAGGTSQVNYGTDILSLGDGGTPYRFGTIGSPTAIYGVGFTIVKQAAAYVANMANFPNSAGVMRLTPSLKGPGAGGSSTVVTGSYAAVAGNDVIAVRPKVAGGAPGTLTVAAGVGGAANTLIPGACGGGGGGGYADASTANYRNGGNGGFPGGGGGGCMNNGSNAFTGAGGAGLIRVIWKGHAA